MKALLTCLLLLATLQLVSSAITFAPEPEITSEDLFTINKSPADDMLIVSKKL